SCGGRRGRARQHQSGPRAEGWQLFEGETPLMQPSQYMLIGVIVLAFGGVAIVLRIAPALVHRPPAVLRIVSAEHRAAAHARARQLMRALTILAYGVAALAAITLALGRFGIQEPRWDPRLFGHWALTRGVNLVLIAIGAFIVVRAANLAIEHLQF